MVGKCTVSAAPTFFDVVAVGVVEVGRAVQIIGGRISVVLAVDIVGLLY